MLSYAQNAEDVVLRRVFADVERGFYVDVGASSPTEDSVTHVFYTQGWRGVNVEPDPHDYEQLTAARPRDVNLHAAVGSGRDPIMFYPSVTRGLGTVDPELARNRECGPPREVPQLSLDHIFETYAPAKGVDFLKVDTEGWEADVLASADWERTRPRVVVVEAMDANGSATHEAWEPHLLKAGYRLGLFDGLNRFYCRGEEAERLLPRLAAPANVFDEWRPVREVAIQKMLQESLISFETALQGERRGHMETRMALLAEQRASAEMLVAEQRASAQMRRSLDEAWRAQSETLGRLTAIYDSTSWRITAPLRDASRLARLLRRGGTG